MSRHSDHVAIDGVDIAFGEVVEVIGQCRKKDSDQVRTRASALLEGIRINGRANQDAIEFHLFPTANDCESAREQLQGLVAGNWYRVRGRLLAARVAGVHKRLSLVVDESEPTLPAPLRFADFAGREEVFEGTAQDGVLLKWMGQTARLEGLDEWPGQLLGRPVSVRGVVRGDEVAWRIEKPTWTALALSDQLDQDVSLEGVLWCSNGEWCFLYRGERLYERLYLTAAAGSALTFSSDEQADNDGRRARVTGRLVRQDRPSFRQLSEKRDRDLVPYFVVRGAKVEYLEEPVRWGEMFGTIYEPSPVSDGVPELLPQSPIGQALGNETEVMMFARGNAQTIRDIVREDSPETRLVLARRMADAELAEPLRLLYAAILAALNDDRGREFLSNCVESPKPVNLNVLYCLGEFPSFASEKCPVRPMVTFRRTLHGPRNT